MYVVNKLIRPSPYTSFNMKNEAGLIKLPAPPAILQFKGNNTSERKSRRKLFDDETIENMNEGEYLINIEKT